MKEIAESISLHGGTYLFFYWQTCNFNQKLPDVLTVFMSNF